MTTLILRDHPPGPSSSADSSAAGLYCDEHGLRLDEVATHGWLVRQVSSQEAFSGLVGCIEEHHGDFEVMQIGGGFHWTTFHTLLAAVMHLTAVPPRANDERRYDAQRDASDSLSSAAPSSAAR